MAVTIAEVHHILSNLESQIASELGDKNLVGSIYQWLEPDADMTAAVSVEMHLPVSLHLLQEGHESAYEEPVLAINGFGYYVANITGVEAINLFLRAVFQSSASLPF